MRKYLIVSGLIVYILLSGASFAFASGYSTPSSGNNPHGNYSDTGDKCKVCHAVHNASSTGQTLLRSSRSEACVYCHVSNNFTIKRPYGTTLSNYTQEKDWNHDDSHKGAGQQTTYDGCISCHSVHGANTFGGASKILKNDPGKAIATPVDTLEKFCCDCHNYAGGNLLTGGCFKTCHKPSSAHPINPEYYLTTRDGVTHIMTDTLTGNYGTEVAWISSGYCKSCHKAGQPYADGDSFPHYTPNAVQFLDYEYTQQDTNLDLVCMNCHTNTGDGDSYTSGVGKTF